MKNTAQAPAGATGPARFKVDDLVEYTNPETGVVYIGRIVIPYTEGSVFDEDGHFQGRREGYGCMYLGYDFDDRGRPYFAHASSLRLLKHPELVAARQACGTTFEEDPKWRLEIVNGPALKTH